MCPCLGLRATLAVSRTVPPCRTPGHAQGPGLPRDRPRAAAGHLLGAACASGRGALQVRRRDVLSVWGRDVRGYVSTGSERTVTGTNPPPAEGVEKPNPQRLAETTAVFSIPPFLVYRQTLRIGVFNSLRGGGFAKICASRDPLRVAVSTNVYLQMYLATWTYRR